MDLKQLLSWHMKTTGDVNARQARIDELRKKADALQKDAGRIKKAASMVDALRQCYFPGGLFAGGPCLHVFVRGIETDTSHAPTSLSCVIVPEMVIPAKWERPLYRNPDGSTTWGAEDVTPEDVVREAVQRYREGAVTTGTLDDVLRQPCGHCGSEALVACSHTLDWEDNWQSVAIGRLCLSCPRIEKISDDHHPASGRLKPIDHPLLPRRKEGKE